MVRLGQWAQFLECVLLPAFGLCISTLSHGPACAEFFYNTASDGTCWLHWYIIFFGGVITMNIICFSILFIVQMLHRRWKKNIHVEYELLDYNDMKKAKESGWIDAEQKHREKEEKDNEVYKSTEKPQELSQQAQPVKSKKQSPNTKNNPKQAEKRGESDRPNKSNVRPKKKKKRKAAYPLSDSEESKSIGHASLREVAKPPLSPPTSVKRQKDAQKRPTIEKKDTATVTAVRQQGKS
ncbi:hypothetical protein WR25_25263 [Diploscapter pachys]|uniref:Uncharacterized protein n=1 Tax=Diploscapter pachys TaxID=2018661 RepID=A0A2A2J910_9BILA|nr:hypothetical protein WR25_25263 [Diploscapter pachys]